MSNLYVDTISIFNLYVHLYPNLIFRQKNRARFYPNPIIIRKGYLIIFSMRNELQELFLYANGFQFCNPNGYPNHEA